MNAKIVRRKILIIDDEVDLLVLVKEILEEKGYQVFCAANGADGIRLNKRENPDLIILDVHMPGMDGIKTLRRIRKHDSDVRVVFMTSDSDPDLIRDTAALDVSEYLSKPFDNEQLVRVVDRIIRRQGREND